MIEIRTRSSTYNNHHPRVELQAKKESAILELFFWKCTQNENAAWIYLSAARRSTSNSPKIEDAVFARFVRDTSGSSSSLGLVRFGARGWCTGRWDESEWPLSATGRRLRSSKCSLSSQAICTRGQSGQADDESRCDIKEFCHRLEREEPHMPTDGFCTALSLEHFFGQSLVLLRRQAARCDLVAMVATYI